MTLGTRPSGHYRQLALRRPHVVGRSDVGPGPVQPAGRQPKSLPSVAAPAHADVDAIRKSGSPGQKSGATFKLPFVPVGSAQAPPHSTRTFVASSFQTSQWFAMTPPPAQYTTSADSEQHAIVFVMTTVPPVST